MLKQVEGSQAVADAVALCRPEVVCAYPITPQTHIVEGLGERVKSGQLKGCDYINVESEFAAMSVAIGSSVAGARVYTATSSQGLLFMTEAVYNASGMGLPIVMTLGNRAIGAPLNIWNDQTDSMTVRDAGWVQLFAEDNQEAVDLHIQAFRLAEMTKCPVMVCVDGFILTHAIEPVDVPDQKQVDTFLPKFEPAETLDPKAPITLGAMVGPEAFTEVRYLEHKKQDRVLAAIPQIAAEFKKIFGREAGGLVRSYRTQGADIVFVAMGSVVGTLKDVIDDERKQGRKIGVVSLCSFRPFPTEEVQAALGKAKRIVVLDKSIFPGQSGVLATHVRLALGSKAKVISLIAGLGGRPILKAELRDFIAKVRKGDAEELHFLNLNTESIKPWLGKTSAKAKQKAPAKAKKQRSVAAVKKTAKKTVKKPAKKAVKKVVKKAGKKARRK